MRRYAEHTKVPANKTRLEIEETLRRAGADGFASGYQGNVATVQFMMQGLTLRFRLELPSQGRAAKAEQEERRLWRALQLIIKAKIEAINSGVATFEDEFIGAIVVGGGQTVAEWLGPQIAEATKSGKMPRLMLGAVEK